MTSSLVALTMSADIPKLHENELPMEHVFYGIIAMCVFLGLLAVLWSFRNTAYRFSQPREQQGKKEH